MIIEAIVFSIAAVVISGTYMGLKFAAEFDPELRRVKEEKTRAKEHTIKLPASQKAKKIVDEALDKSTLFPSVSKRTIKTQVTLFPEAFGDEERKRLIAWANET